MSDNIFCRLIDLPCGIKAVTLPNNDGTYNVYINARLSDAEQRSEYLHEIVHITGEHFYIGRNVIDCEIEAKEKSRKLIAALS